MIRRLVLAAAAATIVASPAQAGCNRPYAPTIKVGPGATAEDIKVLRADVASFIKASDIYQACLLALKKDERMLSANQMDKERVGREFNAVFRAFKASRPG